MKKFLMILILLIGFTFSCTTERRGDQGEYSEDDNEIIKEDSVAEDSSY